MAGTRDLLCLAGADRSRFFYSLLGGWALFGLIFIIAMNDLGCPSCPEDAIDRFLGMKILNFCLLYALAPWVIRILGIHQNTAVMAGLPLSRRQVNQALLMTGGVQFLCCLPAWAFLVWRLPAYGIPIHPWMFVSVALIMFLFQLYGMVVNLWWRSLIPAIVPLLVFPPHRHETFRWIFEAMTTPWASLGLLILIILALPRVMSYPLPLKARCP